MDIIVFALKRALPRTRGPRMGYGMECNESYAERLFSYFKGIDEKFVLYGCGTYGNLLANVLWEHRIVPAGACDRDPLTWGTALLDTAITSPEEAGKAFGGNAVFVNTISSFVRDPMKQRKLTAQLEGFGCKNIVQLPNELWNTLFLTAEFSLELRHGAFWQYDKNIAGCTVKNGERHVPDSPDNAVRTFWILGDSTAFGVGLLDTETIGAHLQHMLNKIDAGWQVRIIGNIHTTALPLNLRKMPIRPNDAVGIISSLFHLPDLDRRMVDDYCRSMVALHKYCQECGARFLASITPGIFHYDELSDYELRHLRHSPVCRSLVDDGKILNREDMRALHKRKHLFFLRYNEYITRVMNANGISFLKSADSLNALRKNGEHIFLDHGHLRSIGNLCIAKMICSDFILPVAANPIYSDRDVFDDAVGYMKAVVAQKYRDDPTLGDEVRSWLDGIPRHSATEGGKAGAIVMNCNPMTHGHLHLIRHAAERVEQLYIFIVQEDRSDFPFAERFSLVLDVLRDERIRAIVRPSGKFILSSFTFNGYFGKERNQNPDDDPTADIALFGAVIAPALKITRRFAAEEPLCAVTNKYNATMLDLLPGMGVDMEIIPRLTNAEGEIISASLVRQLFKERRFDSIRKIVPLATYKKLMKYTGFSENR